MVLLVVCFGNWIMDKQVNFMSFLRLLSGSPRDPTSTCIVWIAWIEPDQMIEGSLDV